MSRPYLQGFLYMLIAMTLMPLADALSKLLTDRYPPEIIAWMRYLVLALLLLPVVSLKFTRTDLFPKAKAAHFSRCISFIIATTLYISALKFMPIADSIAILFIFPFIVTALSPRFLDEAISRLQWIAVFVGFIGVCLIVRPGIAPFNPGTLLCLLSSFCYAHYVIMTRKLRSDTPAFVLLFLPALVGSIIMLPIIWAKWTTPTAADLNIMILIGAITGVVHLLIISAYKLMEASTVATLSYMQIGTAVLFGYVFFKDLPDWATTIGIGIIILSGIILVQAVKKPIDRSLQPRQ